MSSTVATMPSSISSGSTEHRRNPSDTGTHGFTAVNITPPHSRESSATSPDPSPRHTSAGAGRTAAFSNTSNYYQNVHDNPPLKRQRSMSSEPGQQSPRRYDYQPPRKTESQQHMADRALHVLDSANKPPPHSYYSTAPAAHEHPGYQYERSYSNTSGLLPTPDSRVNDPYPRDSTERHYASSTTGGDQEKNDDPNDRSTPPQNGQKRKRNFSNRTKTGCITCRGRKKKCDEARPLCNNCIRGGFSCAGYNHTRPGSWPKTTPQKQPVPLQSKENDDSNHYQVETPVSANPASLETSQTRPVAANGGHDQPRPHYAPQPSAPIDPARPSYSGQQQQHHSQWPQHAQHQHPPPQQPQSQPQHGPSPQSSYPSENLPSLSELTRPESQQTQSHPHQAPPRQDYPTTPHHDMSRPSTQHNAGGPPPAPAPTPGQWHQHQQHQPQQQQQHPMPPYQPVPQQQEYGTRPNPYPPRIDTTQTQHLQTNVQTNTANTAHTASTSYSSYGSKAASKIFSQEDVERSKMLRGVCYNYLDPQLRAERQRCATALARYNRACEWDSGVSETELQSMLAKVFDPQLDHTHSSIVVSLPKGCLGPGVKIEQGFRCTYGYNLRIYDNVFIGENTRIDDSAKVEIGPRTWIGPDVKILTNDVAKDMVYRKGTDGQLCSTLPVTIGPEVVIGTGAIIYPGAKLAKGSTVEPYAVVKGDVGEYITQKVSVGAQMGGTIIN